MILAMRSTAAGPNAFLLVFDISDEIVETLRRFAGTSGMASAHFTGIGGLHRATIAYWNWDTKRYEDIAVEEQVEIMSIIGNITRSPTDLKVHAHVVLGRRDGSTIGGHLKEGFVRPTAELVVTAIPNAISRERDATTALDLIKL
jgi:uncharacterized protein